MENTGRQGFFDSFPACALAILAPGILALE